MTDYYVDSGGDDSDGLSWSTAYQSLDNALDPAGKNIPAGSTVYVASGHTESGASVVILNNNGTSASPITVITADSSSGEPPSTYQEATGTTIQAQPASNNDLFFEGAVTWVGVHFGTSDIFATNFSGTTARCHNYFYNCHFEFFKAAAGEVFNVGQSGETYFYMENCQIKHAAATLAGFNTGSHNWVWLRGCSYDGTGTAPNQLFNTVGPRGIRFRTDSCDWSGMASSNELISSNGVPVNDSDGCNTLIEFRGCLLPTSGGVIDTAPTQRGYRYEAHSIDVGDNIIGFEVGDQYGTAVENTSTYRTATYDGTNGYSVLLTPTARTKKWMNPIRFKLPDFWAAENSTLTVHVTYDGSAVKNDVLWIEVEYPDATTGALGKFTTSKPTLVTDTPASLGAGGTWTSGKTNTESMAITLSDSQAGVHRIWVCLAPEATSPAVYVDPYIDVT